MAVRGLKKHLKRLAAPRHWMLSKMEGTFAPRPAPGPHKLRECVPLVVLIRNRLKYALTRNEVVMILMNRDIKVDGKARTEPNYPTGLMDVVSIEKTNEHFRMLLDTKGRYCPVKIDANEASFKLGKVVRVGVGAKGVPYIVTHDARTIRYPDPDIAVHDVVQIDLATNKVKSHIRLETGNICIVTAGHNIGRVGLIKERERHPGGADMAHIEGVDGAHFATRLSNIFMLGKGKRSLVQLHKSKGVKADIFTDRAARLARLGRA